MTLTGGARIKTIVFDVNETLLDLRAIGARSSKRSGPGNSWARGSASCYVTRTSPR